MKYITRNQSGGFDLTDYGEYLDKERERLTSVVEGDELLTIDRFTLDRRSLHDSRLEQLLVAKSANGSQTAKQPSTRVEIRLKGAYFDREFLLFYEDVRLCTVETPAPEEDLLVHELRLESDGLVHELHFASGKTIELICGRLRFQEAFAAERQA